MKENWGATVSRWQSVLAGWTEASVFHTPAPGESLSACPIKLSHKKGQKGGKKADKGYFFYIYIKYLWEYVYIKSKHFTQLLWTNN